MPRLRRFACLFAACLAVARAWAAPAGARVEYVGGTLSALATNTEGRLRTTDPHFLLLAAKGAELRIPYEDINLLEYGQNASRRYVLALTISPILLLSKSRRHFLTIGYQDPEGRQQALVFRVHKDDLRPLLASLEARTGRKVEYQDGEARKSGAD
ncbi:MAG: hypothetical protein K6T59_00185 [Bryobacteraceae bacterium]|nr:hypothetical protein [Bryobacteraceae bacterium]